mmetsp:Transcript_23678/g.39082  ORF Transcript_23678/g.39082 Transcript_23678/m.39082 type:complete len:86 (-) Transcript_23678:291-548(-)
MCVERLVTEEANSASMPPFGFILHPGYKIRPATSSVNPMANVCCSNAKRNTAHNSQGLCKKTTSGSKTMQCVSHGSSHGINGLYK